VSDDRAPFKGTVRELLEHLEKAIESWTPEQKATFRRGTRRQIRDRKTAEGEWIN
jgi:hypothetical protein